MSKGLEALRKLSEMGYLNIPMPKPNVEWTDEDDKALGYAYDIQRELEAFDKVKDGIDWRKKSYEKEISTGLDGDGDKITETNMLILMNLYNIMIVLQSYYDKENKEE